MNKKLYILRGLPGSGKSTLANHIVKDSKNTFRVNKDLLRKMLHFEDFLPRHEKLVAEINDSLVVQLLKEGRNVISDNTNLSEKDINFYNKIAEENKAEVVIYNVDTPIEECISRDLRRKRDGERYVGRDVILNMAHRYRLIKQEKLIAIFDLDGTLADISHRRHYVRKDENIPNFKPNWKKFFEEVSKDKVREVVYDKLCDHVSQGHEIVICSGRPESTRVDTENWLRYNSIHHDRLIMRPNGDNRDDVILKQGFLDKLIDKSKIVYVADDRPKVVRMWIANKLNVEDFGDGVEF